MLSLVSASLAMRTGPHASPQLNPTGYCGWVPGILTNKITFHGNSTARFPLDCTALDCTADLEINIMIAKQEVICKGEKVTVDSGSVHFTDIATTGDCMGDALRAQGKDPSKYFMDVNADGSLTFHSDGYPNLKMKKC